MRNPLPLFFLIALWLLASPPCLAAQNIILVIGDGMGLGQISAHYHQYGYSAISGFSQMALVDTRSANKLIPDSASSATAYATGVDTNNGVIGIGPEGEILQNIFESAKKHKINTGLVVSSRITHATPAAFYAHAKSRKNEASIAQQLARIRPQVIIGGGLQYFSPNTDQKTTRHLLQKMFGPGYDIFLDSQQLLSNSPVKPILALLSRDHLPPASRREYRMTALVKAALHSLEKQDEQFLLVIEASQIDFAGHKNNASYLYAEMDELDELVNYLIGHIGERKNSLFLLTGDHETGGLSLLNGGSSKSPRLSLHFASDYHSAVLIPLFAAGKNAKLFSGILANEKVGQLIRQLLIPSQ